MRSVIFSLIDPVQCCVLNRGLPNNAIRFLNKDTIGPASFPSVNWPSFADVLCDGGSKTLVGLTFYIHSDSKKMAEKVTRNLSAAIAELKKFDATNNDGIYKDHPKSSWLEIKWSSVKPNRLIDVQSCNVLWYPTARHPDIPIAMGIEDLDYLVKEADYDLVVPSFPFPHLAMEFLND